mmetsp:Transcript_16766/g.19328  ORF Transcript_16766/g.19328 Transcript_16766/m.19328 type:complete len:498 (-) Transcript_16766:230-1723(-)
MKQARLAAERRRSRSQREGPPQIIKIEDLVKKEKEAEVEKQEEVEVEKKIYGDVVTKKETNKKDVVDEPPLYKRHARLASARRRSSTRSSKPEERVVVDTEGRKSMTHIKEHPKDFPAMAKLLENMVTHHSTVESTTAAVVESRPPATKVIRPTLRFHVQDRVDCNIDNRCWKRGTIMELWYQGPHKHVMPYAIQLDNGAITYAPSDDDRAIRRARAPEAEVEDAFSAKEALKDAAAIKTAATANAASTKDDAAAVNAAASTKDDDATKDTAKDAVNHTVKHTAKHTLYQHTATDVEWCLDAVECGEGAAADESSGTDETDIEESDEDDDDVVVNNNNDDDDDTEDDAPPLLLSKHNPTVVIPVMASHLEMDLSHQRLEATYDYSSLSLPHDQIKISGAQQLPLQQPPTVGDAQLQDPDQQQKHLISLENGPLHPLPSTTSSSTTTTINNANNNCAVVASQQQQQQLAPPQPQQQQQPETVSDGTISSTTTGAKIDV